MSTTTVPPKAPRRTRPPKAPRAKHQQQPDGLDTIMTQHRQDRPVSSESEFRGMNPQDMASFFYQPERVIADPQFREAVLATIWPEVERPEWNKREERQTALLALASGLCQCLRTSKAMGVHLSKGHYKGRAKGRYAIEGYTYAIVESTVKALEATGWLAMHPGYCDREGDGSISSRVWPSDRFALFALELSCRGVCLGTVRKTQKTELVILKDTEKRLAEYSRSREGKRFRRTREVLELANHLNGTANVVNPNPRPLEEDYAGMSRAMGLLPEDSPSARVTGDMDIHNQEQTKEQHRMGHHGEEASGLTSRGNTPRDTWIAKTHRVYPSTILGSFSVISLFRSNLQSTSSHVDTELHAVFNNGSCEQGGRLYCAGPDSYQCLPHEERAGLLIDGEPVVELDYSSLHPAMLYADRGIQLEDDPYLSIVDGDDSLRGVAKKLVLVSLNNTSKRGTVEAVLKGWRDGEGAPEAVPGNEWRTLLNRLYDHMLEVHAHIADSFDKGLGLRLQNRDSAMVLDILDEVAVKRGIVCLPVHDSAIVQARHEDTLRQVMEDVYRKHNHGFSCKVARK